METPLAFGMEMASFGLAQLQRELAASARLSGLGMPDSGNVGRQMNQSVRLSTTPAEDILNQALDIRRRVQANGGAV